MPTKNGNQVHQVIGEHPATSLGEFIINLQENDFVLVEEFYREQIAEKNVYYSVGETAINYRYIGKIKVLSNNNRAKRPAVAPDV